MKNREALIKIGFGGNLEPVGRIDTEVHRIYVDSTDLSFSVLEIETKRKILEGFPKDIEQLKKICSPYLDFTAKPKYDWEAVKEELENHKSMFEDCFNSIDKISAYGWIPKQEALSMIAKLKLNIIIQQIDKDYPRDVNKHNQEYGTFFVPNGYGRIKVKGVYHNCLGVPILTATTEGAQILLDQNPQLLQNLFKIETDATG